MSEASDPTIEVKAPSGAQDEMDGVEQKLPHSTTMAAGGPRRSCEGAETTRWRQDPKERQGYRA